MGPFAGAAVSGQQLVSVSLRGPTESHNSRLRLDHFNGSETKTENYLCLVVTFSYISDMNDLLGKSAALPGCEPIRVYEGSSP